MNPLVYKGLFGLRSQPLSLVGTDEQSGSSPAGGTGSVRLGRADHTGGPGFTRGTPETEPAEVDR